jgi:branched-subunit amino acid aminotransferase/4-amino-4-deoxychorismate lyase
MVIDPGGEVAWVDGRFLPRADLALPVGDAGFVMGATVTEQLRTFHGRPFLLPEHLERLAESLAVVGIEPPLPLADFGSAAEEVAARNHAVLAGAASGGAGPPPDLGLVVFVTPGDLAAQHGGRGGRPRAMIHTFPLAFTIWADAYEHGVSLRSVTVRQVPEACWPIRAKVRSRLHYWLADREAHAAEPGARGVLAHADGRISETSTANVAIVSSGVIHAPPACDALVGVSLGHARRLAAARGLGWRERSLTATDLATADEILLTSTPSCILPATRFDGQPVGAGTPGPVFRGLLDAWNLDVDLDIAAQARAWRGRPARSAS